MLDYKKELEEFAYIVSHDLNAPFRHIKEFGRLLVNRLDKKITEEEREYLRYMEEGIDKSHYMLEALLSYSRLNTTAENFTQFNCLKLVGDVLSDFDLDTYKNYPNVELSGLNITITGDYKQIRLLFTHLIDNALKFTQHKSSPLIEINAYEEDESMYFTVKDNGLGMPPKQCQNVFRMFRRLDPENGLPGIGAGLALAKKIVCRHEGQIWIESCENVQTQITFSLPVFSPG